MITKKIEPVTRKPSKWLVHVKKTAKANKGMPLKNVLVIAKKTYK